MMTIIKNTLHRFSQHFLLSLIIALHPIVVQADVADSLRSVLTTKKTPSDSLPVMFDLFDCTHYTMRHGMLENIYYTALRAKNDKAMLAVLFQMANYYQRDRSMRPRLLELVEMLPDGEAKDRMRLYVKVVYGVRDIRSLSERDRKTKLLETLAKYRDSYNLSKNEQIKYLFYLCAYLRNNADSDLLVKYLRELRKLIDELPADELSFRSLYYNQAALSFFNNELYEEAIRANKKVLDVNHSLNKIHESYGRHYRNYDVANYRCYHNILMCYEVLTDEEVDMYHDIMQALAADNDRIQADTNLLRRGRIAWLMAKKKYAEALPLIKEQLADSNNADNYHYFVRMLAKAAKESGNKNELFNALKLTNNILKQRLETNSDLSLQELQMVYEVNRLQEKNHGLAHEQQRIELDHRQQLLQWVVVGLIVLTLCLVWLLFLVRRSSILARSLNAANNRIVEERNVLQKTQDDLVRAMEKTKNADRVKNDFVDNMSKELRTPLAAVVEYSHLIADIAFEDERSYINEYAERLDLNVDLLQTLVNDVLDLPSMENGMLSVRVSSVSVQEMCRFTIDLVSKHLSPGVRLIFLNDGQNDTTILTDSNKVEQILLHMLLNAAKFTEEGTISFGYTLNPERTKITFTVTDTGIGVPQAMQDAIFTRFKKVDPNTQGNGLGLYIGRLLAAMLKGKLVIDKEYRTGARFNLTIPVKN